MRCVILLTCLLAVNGVQAAELVAGPMPGHSAMRQVKVWLQTDEAAEVTLRYWVDGQADTMATTRPVTTRPETAHAATVDVVALEPGTEYRYEVLIDGEAHAASRDLRFVTQPLWQWRDDPPDFRFALGSCAYVNETRYDRPGEPYGGDYRIFEAIADRSPDFMLWLGDNVYYREADWDSRSGMYARYSHTRSLPEMQRLLGAAHHYAIWDDHDYGPNNADRGYAKREQALEVFDTFWPNPDFSAAGTGGVTNYFEWHDVAFFLLDNRYFRQANYRVSGERTILGEDQIEWLIDALKTSNASFRFVVMGGQFLNSAEVHETYARIAPGERREILDRIEAERIPGVIFLSGDRHHSVFMKKERYRTYPLHEWTVSPLTAGAGSPTEGAAQYMVEDSIYGERNFGTIEISGPRDQRVATLILHDSDGAEVWREEIRQSDLQP
ncbi:MAG: alkaline phosphatase D family protein [Wenzhouxiangella sp.]